MERLRIVTDDEPEPEVTKEDLERVQRALVRVQEILNDPVALMDRARGLLTGTATKIEGLI